MTTIQIERLSDAIPLPSYETAGAAGMDLRASRPAAIAPGQRALVMTGIRLAIPEGFEAQVRPRSGLALRHGVTVLNAPGTIDSDYRGEVGVILINHGSQPFTITPGDRIAQMVVAPCVRAAAVEAAHLDQTERSAGGFGSTGGVSA